MIQSKTGRSKKKRGMDMNFKKLKAIIIAAALVCTSVLCVLPACAAEYSENGATVFSFGETTVDIKTGSSTGYETDGCDIKITESGTYVFKGSCADGSITVKKGTSGVVLILSGLNLESKKSAPLVLNKSSEVTVVVKEGTQNSLCDSALNNDDEYADNESAENAVIKCKDGSNVVICGGGVLNITANGKNGIKSGATTDTEGKASLTVKELTLNITANVNDAINAEATLNIESGNINISAKDDAIHSDYYLNIGNDVGNELNINIKECYEGLEAAELNIISGNIDINASDDGLNAANSDLQNYDFEMNIKGGNIYVYTSSGDGLDSNGNISISSGVLTVWTANSADNQPLDADGTVSITGGTVLAAGASGGMGTKLSTEQPTVTFGSSVMGGFGGRMPGGDFGGKDGMTQKPSDRTENGTGGRPQDNGTDANGGDYVGLSFETGAKGGFDKGGMSGTKIISARESFSITDSDGNSVYTGTAVCDTVSLIYSSADIKSGGEYGIMINGSSVSSATASTGSSGVSGDDGGMQKPETGNNNPTAVKETNSNLYIILIISAAAVIVALSALAAVIVVVKGRSKGEKMTQEMQNENPNVQK